MRRNFVVVGITLLLFASWLPGKASAAEKTIKLEFTTVFTAMHKVTVLLEEMSKEIGKKTDGRVKITVYPAATLVPTVQTYDSVVKGIADMGFGSLTFNQGRFPLSEVLDLPSGARTSYMQSRLALAFYKKFQPKELSDVKVLFFPSQPPGILHAQKSIKILEELKGLKVRVTGGTTADIVSALGAVPVAMPMGDTYDALRKGVVNALMAAYEPLENRKLCEVVQYSIESWRTAYGATGYVIMNKDKWNALPPDVKNIVQQTADEYADKVPRGWDEFEQGAKKYAVGRGDEIITLSKPEEDRWAERIKPLFEKYVKDKTAKGLPAKEALAFCQEFIARNQQ